MKPRDALRSFAALFVATWFVQVATCEYSFGWGTLQLNQPLVLLLAALAAHRHGLLGRRWRPRGSVIALAAILPGGTVASLTAGLLDLKEVSYAALALSRLGAFVIGAWWLWSWGEELPAARRRAKLAAILLAVTIAITVAMQLLATAWAPPGGWPRLHEGTSVAGVPLAQVSSMQAAALQGLFFVGLFAGLAMFLIIPASLWRAARLLGEEPAREPPAGASRVEPHPRARRDGLLAFLGIGLVGSIGLVASSLVFVPSVRLPTWLVGPAIWAFAAWFAGRWLDADSAVFVSKEGLFVDNRLEPWASFGSWDAAHDRFTLRGASGPRVIPLDEDDPRRAVVERWIEGDESAALPDNAAPAPSIRPASRRPLALAAVATLLIGATAFAFRDNLGRALARSAARRSDAEVVAGLRRIAAAEVAFRSENGRFGSLEDLDKAGSLAKDSLPKHIYFRARTTKITPGAKWWAVAVANLSGDETTRTVFYTNETGQIWTLEIQGHVEEHGMSWSWHTPDDFGDTSAPPPKAVLDTTH